MLIDLDNCEIKVLDKGFVRLVDCMPRWIPQGSEELRCDYSIAEAARVSYGGQTKDPISDIRLVRYLLRNKHTSPFEMVKFKFHIKLPIFVQRQLIRHRTANVNEISGRYTQLVDEFYQPEELRAQSKTNKQGSSKEKLLMDEQLHDIYAQYKHKNDEVYELYEGLIKYGVAKEVARICLPQNIYTELYWCIDLHNLMHFLTLRNSEHAQFEIREYAKALYSLIQGLCPISTKAYEDFFVGSVSFSTKELSLVKKYLNGETDITGQFMTKREETEFKDKMNRLR